MKKALIFGIFGLLFLGAGTAQASEVKAIKKTITAFAKAGDRNDAQALGKHLDANYRIVMNRMFGSKEVSVMPREVYLQKIKDKEFGGDKRKLTFEKIVINGPTASAKVVFKGSKMTFVSLITLVRNENGVWQLVNDTPVIR